MVPHLLPKFYHSTGHGGGVDDAVVGEAAICVPGIVTLFPRQCLQRHSGRPPPLSPWGWQQWSQCAPFILKVCWASLSHYLSSPSQRFLDACHTEIPILEIRERQSNFLEITQLPSVRAGI